MNLKKLKNNLDNLEYVEDLFGIDASKNEAKKIFKRFRAIAHEDKFDDPIENALAHELFIRINDLWKIAEKKFDTSTYGNKSVKLDTFNYTIKSKRNSYTVVRTFNTCNLCDVYLTNNDEIVKVARTHKDNSLLEREEKVFKIFNASDKDILKKTVPEHIESFNIKNKTKQNIRVNVLKNESTYIPLSKLKELYPDGIHGRHIIWILKRLLMTIGYAHDLNIVHGCINLDNVLIEASTHSLMIIDWCYSVEAGTNLTLIDSKYKGYYPKEVFDKQAADFDLDIYMIGKCINDLKTEKCPTEINWLLNTLTIDKKHSRYKDAWKVYGYVSDVAKQVYGDAYFMELKV